MTPPEIWMALVVVVVGIPAAWWNPTAAALVISWIMGEVVYILVGDNLPTLCYLVGDAFVLAVIYDKAAQHFPGRGTHIREIFRDAFCMDRFVLAIFPVMWALYWAPIHDYYRWWSLYFLVIAQFVAAGWEALHPRPCDYPQVGDREDTRLMCQAANDPS